MLEAKDEINTIIILPHYCSKEEYQELKDYLTEKCWNWQEISSGKSTSLMNSSKILKDKKTS